MLYLWIFGDNVEDRLGHGRFLAFYLLCGVVAALGHVAMDPSSTLPTIGRIRITGNRPALEHSWQPNRHIKNRAGRRASPSPHFSLGI